MGEPCLWKIEVCSNYQHCVNVSIVNSFEYGNKKHNQHPSWFQVVLTEVMCFCSTLNFVDETYTMVSYLSPKLSESHLSYRDLFYIPKENKVGYFTTYLPWLRGSCLFHMFILWISIFIEWRRVNIKSSFQYTSFEIIMWLDSKD